MADSLSHFHMFDFQARAAVAVTTDLVREAQRRHGLDPVTTIAVGRAISCAAVLASTLKQGKEYVHCAFAGTGMLNKVIGECNGDGECRGYASPPRIMEGQPADSEAPASVGEALGGGFLTVTRGRPGEGSPYSAVIEMQSAEIASDVARYLTESEQIPSAVAAGVKLSPEGEVLGAGAALVQQIGGAVLPEATLTALEDRIANHLNLSERIADGASPAALVALMAGEDKTWGELATRPLKFHCACTRESMAEALVVLGEEQVRSIQAEVGKIEVRCHYCSTTHVFKLEELLRQ